MNWRPLERPVAVECTPCRGSGKDRYTTDGITADPCFWCLGTGHEDGER